MQWRSHVLIGALSALLILYLLGVRQIIELGIITIFGALSALIPDLDMEISKGKRVLDVVFILFSLIIAYFWVCGGNLCNANVSFLVIWLAILGVYFLIFRFFKPRHRGITHTLGVALAFGLLIFYLLDWKLGLAAFIGYFSHLVADKEIKLM